MNIMRNKMDYKYKICSGVGEAQFKLNAFDRALVKSGVGNYNLIKVSSILPKGSKITNSIELEQGSLLPVAYAAYTSDPCGEGKELSAAIAIGIPEDQDSIGVIMEWSGLAPEKYAKEQVTEMVKCAMADRNIENYNISIKSVSGKTSQNNYVCVFACVSIMHCE